MPAGCAAAVGGEDQRQGCRGLYITTDVAGGALPASLPYRLMDTLAGVVRLFVCGHQADICM